MPEFFGISRLVADARFRLAQRASRPPRNNTPSAAIQATTPAPIKRANVRESALDHGISQAATVQHAASAANSADTVETVSRRCEHVDGLSSPAQNACSPHPANTDRPHNAASRKLAIVGTIGETRSRSTSYAYPVGRE